MMARGLEPVGDTGKFTWRSDLRLRVPAPFHVLEEQVQHYASKIKCPMLLLKATGSSYYMQDEIAKRIIKTYIHHNPNFQLHRVEGGHHVHMDKPEHVICLINDFLLKSKFQTFNEENLDKQENFPLDLF